MEFKDWAVVFATLLSPLIAIQVSQYLNRKKYKRDEQLRVFKALLATRATTLDPRHIESLNMIDVVFHGNSKGETEVRQQWKQYLDHLANNAYPKETWGVRRVELLVELLNSMATLLDFNFDKTHIKNQVYFPIHYGDIENDQSIIRRSLVNILSGKVPLWVVNSPISSIPEPTSQKIQIDGK